MAALRLVASDGVLVARAPHTIPDFNSLSRRAKDALYQIMSTEVGVEGGEFHLSIGGLASMTGWSQESSKKALRALEREGFIWLLEESRGRTPRRWAIHRRWNPELSLEERTAP